MTEWRTWRISPGKQALAVVLIALALVACLPAGNAYAQDSPFGFLRNLFRRSEPEEVRPQYRAPPVRHKHFRATARPARPAKPAEPPPPEKQTDAKVVMVVGDFVAAGLSEGLQAAYAQSPGVRIIDDTKGSSGFVRDDFYDWPHRIGELIDKEKPAVVVMMIGSNDRQPMKIGAAREPPQSDAWTQEYQKRAEAFAKAVAERKVPLVWLGMPAFRSSSMSSDMLALNDIFQQAAEDVKADFVDVWDGFADEAGDFVVNGPDVDGQPARLRSDDGINFSKAGKRKLAFYAEKPLDKILGSAALPNEGAPGVPAVSGAPGSSAGRPADQTAPISLADPGLGDSTELLGGADAAGRVDIAGKGLAAEGLAPVPQPGRADDFGGKPKPPAAPAAIGAPARPAMPPRSSDAAKP